jgi:hypothetical protein
MTALANSVEKLVSFKAAFGPIEVLLETAKLGACAQVAKIGSGSGMSFASFRRFWAVARWILSSEWNGAANAN